MWIFVNNSLKFLWLKDKNSVCSLRLKNVSQDKKAVSFCPECREVFRSKKGWHTDNTGATNQLKITN
jgi:hypothetical protein